LLHWRRSVISGQPGNLAGSCRSSSDVERANANYYEIVSQPAPATNITSHDTNWEDYEYFLDLLGEANGPLISDNEVKLRVLTQISTGENQLIFEGFYLDGRAPLGGGFDCEISASRLDFYHKQVKTTRYCYQLWLRPSKMNIGAFVGYWPFTRSFAPPKACGRVEAGWYGRR
jgi:hypothetical protein